MAGRGYHDGWAWNLEPHPFGDADDPRQRAGSYVSAQREAAPSAVREAEMTKSEGGGLRSSSGDLDVGPRARQGNVRRRQYSPNRSWMRDSRAVAIL